MDIDSGRVLYEKNPNNKMLIASTTKIMTCIIVLENINSNDLSKKIKAGDEINKVYGTNIYLEPGEILTIEDLLYGLILRSGNDAAEVLANNIFSDEKTFINKMNEKAQELHMNHTTFENPTGLDDETYNYSTAHDMAILAQYAYQNKTYQKIISTKKYSTKSNIKAFSWTNRMSLLTNYKYCIGGKNGYTPKAGKSLVSYAHNNKNNLSLLIVTLDDTDTYNNHKYLYEKYFSLYKQYTIIDKNNFKISKNFIKEDITIKDSFKYPLTEEELNDITTLVKINTNKNSHNIGDITIKLADKNIGKIKIYKKIKEKEDKNLFSRIKELFR